MWSVWCLILGHVTTRELLEREEGDEGWPCLETCLRCGREWATPVPLELLEGDVEERDPARLGPWESYFCENCGLGPLPLRHDERDRLCGLCDREPPRESWYQR